MSINASIRVNAELILKSLASKYKNENPGLVSECRFAAYDTHYSLIFKLRKYGITTTVKLTQDFRLIGTFSWIPEEKAHLVRDPQSAKNLLNARFQGFVEAIALPALRQAGVAA